MNQYTFTPNYQNAHAIYNTIEQAKFLVESGQMSVDIYQAIIIKASTELKILALQNRK